MAEKVKVSREVAEQIDIGINLHHGEGNFLEHHAEMVGKWRGNTAILNDITTWKMAQILVNGYEIEETLEDIVLARYEQNEINRIKAIRAKDDYQSGYALGYKGGLLDGLELSNKIIKGIND